MLAGAKGIIMFSDPADYSAAGVKVGHCVGKGAATLSILANVEVISQLHFTVICVQPYPDGWNLPGGGAQRGNVLNLNGAGDPLTPGYPAKGGSILL